MGKFIDKNGHQQELNVSITDYAEASDNKMSLRQYLTKKYPTSAQSDVFTQLCASEGLHFLDNKATGEKATSLRAIFNRIPMDASGTTTRENPVQSRVLFPAAVMEAVSVPTGNKTAPVAAFRTMLAMGVQVNSNRIELPVIQDVGDERPMPRAQLTEPTSVTLIKAADRGVKIPSTAFQVLVANEVLDYATISLVEKTIRKKKEQAEFARMGDDLLAVINGNPDQAYAQTGLPAVTAKSFDPAIVTAGTITHKAWMAYLNASANRYIDHVIVDSMETAMAIDTRAGRPTVMNDNSKNRIDTNIQLVFPDIQGNLPMFVAPSEWNLPANTVIGFEKEYGLIEYQNVTADYEAVEQFIMKRAQGFIVESGSMVTRLFDEAFSVMTLTV